MRITDSCVGELTSKAAVQVYRMMNRTCPSCRSMRTSSLLVELYDTRRPALASTRSPPPRMLLPVPRTSS